MVYAGIEEKDIELFDLMHYGNFGIFLIATTVYMMVTVKLHNSVTDTEGNCIFGTSVKLKNKVFLQKVGIDFFKTAVKNAVTKLRK